MSWCRRFEIPGGPGEAHRIRRDYWNAQRSYTRDTQRLWKQGRYDEASALDVPLVPGIVDDPDGLRASFAWTAYRTVRRRWVVAVPSAWVVAVLLFLVLAPLDSTVAVAVAAFIALAAVGLAVVQVRGFREFADALADRAR